MIAFRLSWAESWPVKSVKLKAFIMDSALKYEQYIFWGLQFIKSLKFSFGLSAQPQAIEFLWQKVWAFFLVEDFSGEISKPLTSKD